MSVSKTEFCEFESHLAHHFMIIFAAFILLLYILCSNVPRKGTCQPKGENPKDIEKIKVPDLISGVTKKL